MRRKGRFGTGLVGHMGWGRPPQSERLWGCHR
jgi:hypothetical protein